MEVKNLGFWRTLVAFNMTSGDQSQFDVLWTTKNAIHASLIYNPNYSGSLKWRVLFWRGAAAPDFSSRAWNPNYEDPLLSVSLDTRIPPQTIPPWDPIFDPENLSTTFQQLLFCSGHTFLKDGRLLVVGGHVNSYLFDPDPEHLNYPPYIPPQNNHAYTPPNGFPFAPGNPLSYIFDPFDTASPGSTPEGRWYPATNFTENGYVYMIDGRWYPGAVELADGRVLAMSGFKTNYEVTEADIYYLILNPYPEIYNPDTATWTALTDTEALLPSIFHEKENPINQPYHNGTTYPAAFVIPYGEENAGKVFYATPMRQSYIFDPNGDPRNGYWFEVGKERDDLNCGSCTFMLPLDPSNSDPYIASDIKIVTAGGCCHEAVADTFMINLNPLYSNPDWYAVPDMHFPRTHANAVLLPDGNVLVVGGNEMDNYGDPVYHAELFIPDSPTGPKWLVLPEMQFQRNYHSTALLLPDGRVWVGGGDYDNGDHSMANMEIYTPQYLLEGNRPNILEGDDAASIGGSFTFKADMIAEKVIIIKQGTTTHALNTSQRAIYLEVVSCEPNSEGSYDYVVNSPAKVEIAPPGYYMLFIVLPVSASDSGTQAIPSVAKFIKFEP